MPAIGFDLITKRKLYAKNPDNGTRVPLKDADVKLYEDILMLLSAVCSLIFVQRNTDTHIDRAHLIIQNFNLLFASAFPIETVPNLHFLLHVASYVLFFNNRVLFISVCFTSLLCKY